MLLLSEQDRTRWDARLIAEGVGLLTDALRRRPPTRYAVEAAIAAVHAEAPTLGGHRLVGDRRAVRRAAAALARRRWSSSTGRSRSACATARAAGLDALAPLLADPALATYGYLSAARADFLRRLRRWPEAADGLRGGPGADRQRRRARLPHRPARRRPSPPTDLTRASQRRSGVAAGHKSRIGPTKATTTPSRGRPRHGTADGPPAGVTSFRRSGLPGRSRRRPTRWSAVWRRPPAGPAIDWSPAASSGNFASKAGRSERIRGIRSKLRSGGGLEVAHSSELPWPHGSSTVTSWPTLYDFQQL